MSDCPPGAPPAIEPAPTSVAAFAGPAPAGPLGEPVTCASAADFEEKFGAESAPTPLGHAVRLFFANGGAEVRALRVASDEPGDLLGDPDARTGIHALSQEDFNLLNLAPAAPALPAGLLAHAARFCRDRRAVLIAEPPWAAEGGPAAAADFANALSAEAGDAAADTALYLPRLLLSRAEGTETVAAGGAVAGVIARTDAALGVWQAPAGAAHPLADVGAPAEIVGSADMDALAARGVNTIRRFEGIGTVVWGARTLAAGAEPASEWKYLPVRRTALFLEESLDRGLAWAVFEPSCEPLWANVRHAVEEFLYSLWREDAFQGDRPQDAYFVRCGRSTMTQDDIDQGRLKLLVGFAALRPAEFVVLRIGPFRCRPCREGKP